LKFNLDVEEKMDIINDNFKSIFGRLDSLEHSLSNMKVEENYYVSTSRFSDCITIEKKVNSSEPDVYTGD